MEDADFIRHTLERASILGNDLKLWEEIFKFTPAKSLHAIRGALEVDQKLIIDLTRIFKKKTKALAHGDENLWYEAMHEEQEIIKRYAS